MSIRPALLSIPVFFAAVVVAMPASANSIADCDQVGDPDLGIRGCTAVIKQILTSGAPTTTADVITRTSTTSNTLYPISTERSRSTRMTPGVHQPRPYLQQQRRHRTCHGRLQQGDRAGSKVFVACANRGALYGDEKDYDQAIADDNRALSIDSEIFQRPCKSWK